MLIFIGAYKYLTDYEQSYAEPAGIEDVTVNCQVITSHETITKNNSWNDDRKRK